MSGLLSESTLNNSAPEIPIEFVSEDEMALIDFALAAACSSIPPIRSPFTFQRHARSIQSISVLAKRSLSGLTVPDLRIREWCEKQMEFVLLRAKRKTTTAMKVGSARHTKLEEEVVKKVKVRVKSREDTWALKLLNFMIGANQLLFEGLTRELPVIGFAEGVWMVGVIDEIRMPATEIERNPILVDTKTRVRDTLPAEPQRRNGRLQLMCYKHMWDNLVADNFPFNHFFDFFTLNPHSILSEEIREKAADSGFLAETLDDLVRLYRNTWSMLPPANDQLLLRVALSSGKGNEKPVYTPEEERWKCRFCQFASICPVNNDPDKTPSPTHQLQ
ncbi:Exonuclease V, chloroplastic [Morella rubra]|uniref:Exonuclease V, chloroplastic n=1 Tax=Morella rubra TaxID=262757 RepID=A0A6A1WPC2_9ROSI|nr:Exonuclease V, chloroplastic [Morella rubra]